jgi:Protein of unknown function (DUF3574)
MVAFYNKGIVIYVADSMVRNRISIAVFNLYLMVGCATVPQLSCLSSEQHSINEMLYFGTANLQGVVTPNEWADFLRTSITPRFPKGFTFWQASGQWQNSAKAKIKETSFIVSLHGFPFRAARSVPSASKVSCRMRKRHLAKTLPYYLKKPKLNGCLTPNAIPWSMSPSAEKSLKGLPPIVFRQCPLCRGAENKVLFNVYRF